MHHVLIGMFCTLALALTGSPRAAAAPGERPKPAVVGYRGDGTGVHRDSNPPADFDEKTGKNVVWKVALPSWGHACPTVVNGRVLVLCEPDATTDWPYLLCLDARDGRTLWRRELNHLPGLVKDATERGRIERTWHGLLAAYRRAYTLFNGWFYARGEAREGWEKKFEAEGLRFGGWSGGGYGQLRRMRFKDRAAHAARLKEVARGGLNLETWEHECGMGTNCVGQTFAAPLSDGKWIYVATGLHSYACLGFDGRVRWITSVRGDGSQGGNDYCKNARQPLLYKDLLISDAGALLRAIDRETGRLRWSARLREARRKGPTAHLSVVSPVVLTAGGRDFLLCGGAAPGEARNEGSLLAFSLPDGKPVPVEGWHIPGMFMLPRYDQPDVVFFNGGGEHGGWPRRGDVPPPAAVRFTWGDGKLSAKVLWSGIEGQPARAQASMVYHAGRLYLADGVILDANTGKVLAGGPGKHDRRATPPTRHLLEVAGGRVYGLKEGRSSETKPAQLGTLSVYTLDGKKVSEGTLANAPPEGAKHRQIVETVGWNTWAFSYACPFAVAGDRIYVRSYDYLWCIGAR